MSESKPVNLQSLKKLARAATKPPRARGRCANTEERAAMDEAKALLRSGLPAAAQRLYEVITGRYADGSPCKVPLTDFLAAFKLVADRVGMPAMTQTEVTGEGGQAMALPLVVVIGEDEAEK
jgi:hypothetical protein